VPTYSGFLAVDHERLRKPSERKTDLEVCHLLNRASNI
jgi:hypothetical protein